MAGWAHRLFSFRAVAASAEDLPLRAAGFDAAWSLAVLPTAGLGTADGWQAERIQDCAVLFPGLGCARVHTFCGLV